MFCVRPAAKPPGFTDSNMGISILFVLNGLHLVLSATAVKIGLFASPVLHVCSHGYFRRWPAMVPNARVS